MLLLENSQLVFEFHNAVAWGMYLFIWPVANVRYSFISVIPEMLFFFNGVLNCILYIFFLEFISLGVMVPLSTSV